MNIRTSFCCWLLFCFGFVSAREVPVTIVHTTDLHGFMLSSYDYNGNTDVGGFLRCATLIKSLKQTYPSMHLVDCGDTIQGGPSSWRTDGRIILQAMERLDYDAWVIGNHEFDWGWKNLKKLHDETKLPILGANIVVAPGQEHPLPKNKAYTIVSRDGVKVAYVGLTTPGIPNWSLPDLLGPLLFKGSLETLQEVMPKVREEKPDILVLLTHQGLKHFGDDHANEINGIVKQFPEFDLIIGGHTHKVVEDQRFGDTLYTQAGYHGNWVGQVDLVFDTVKKKLVSMKPRIYPIANNYPQDPELSAEFKKELDATREFFHANIGHAASALTSKASVPGQSPQQELICRAIQAATGADVVLHGALSDREVKAGPLQEADLWKVVPYENRVGVCKLTPAKLETILEENAARSAGFYFMGVLGLCYDLDAHAEAGDRVSNLRLPGGKKLHPRKKLKVALNSYVLASGGRRMNELRRITESPAAGLELLELDTRDAVRDYLKKNNPLVLDGKHCVELPAKGKK